MTRKAFDSMGSPAKNIFQAKRTQSTGNSKGILAQALGFNGTGPGSQIAGYTAHRYGTAGSHSASHAGVAQIASVS
jgi:hypothetical protein